MYVCACRANEVTSSLRDQDRDEDKDVFVMSICIVNTSAAIAMTLLLRCNSAENQHNWPQTRDKIISIAFRQLTDWYMRIHRVFASEKTNEPEVPAVP